MGKALEIRELLRKICGVDNEGLVFFNATIVSVEDETCTIDRNGLQFTDVRLGAVVDGNANNLIIKPADNSMVLIADLSDGLMRDLAVIGWSEIDTITINGGTNGGLTITPTLVRELNKNNDILSGILGVLNGLSIPEPGNGSPSALQTALKGAVTGKPLGNFSQIEDTKIKH